ncbi:MAG: 23S rRNA (guanosine(2251)-2'-O)-methyltransferase RlmB [Gammaproteobacteria bacterium]|nr:MAG: 23S rRNA (guanosine(2251)-2'-O)-methyltransferase RlmB [Gammaproteobacteria bacterium]
MSQEWIWGVHAVEAVLKSRPGDVQELRLQDQRAQELKAVLERASLAGVRAEVAPKQWFAQQFPEANHQGVAALCVPAKALPESALMPLLGTVPQPLVLVLDGVTDPHNLGACLRTAEVAGVTVVVIPKDRAAGLTPVVRKVSSGASERVPLVQVTNLARTLKQLKEAGLWVVGAAGEAEQALYAQDMTGPLVLVMGAEGSGLRRLTREHCDFLVRIPMQGDVGSLNVSVATGIMLFEIVRQKGEIM